MPHDTPLITTIVAGLVLAFIFGALANRLRMPPLVGYLVAGILVGPYTPGFVADTELATELSEIGVILLMFGVGLNFSLKDLVSVQALAVPGALIRIVVATAMGTGLGYLLGWPLPAGILFGLALSVASTVVVLKALQDRHIVDSDKGRIIVGWVIIEDVAMVLALVLIPALAFALGFAEVPIRDPFVDLIEQYANIQLGTWGIIGVTVVKLAAFVGLMLVVGRRLIPMLLHFVAHTGSRELFRLAVLAIALGVAAGAAYLFGISIALGAFFAGMILSESQLSQRAAQETLPLRDAFAVLFFVSVGMLFDPAILWTEPLPVLGTLAIILVGKSAVSYLTLVAFRRPVSTALVVTAGLAQIGEFSFILATLGLGLGILNTEARDLIVAGAIISIIVNPVLFWIAEALKPRVEPVVAATASADLAVSMPNAVAPEEPVPEHTMLANHVVLVGYGRVGTVVADGLKAAGRPFLVIEDAEDRVAAAHAAGLEVIVGNAAGSVLAYANLEGAQSAVIAIPNAFEAGQATQQCRSHNASLFIIARAHSDDEEKYLLDLGANQVIMGEREIGLGMVEIITRDTRAVAEVVAAEAVESALAPVASASSEHGPDIFAPAVERSVAAPVVVAAALAGASGDSIPDEPETEAATPAADAEMPIQTAEVITPDFTARRVQSSDETTETAVTTGLDAAPASETTVPPLLDESADAPFEAPETATLAPMPASGEPETGVEVAGVDETEPAAATFDQPIASGAVGDGSSAAEVAVESLPDDQPATVAAWPAWHSETPGSEPIPMPPPAVTIEPAEPAELEAPVEIIDATAEPVEPVATLEPISEAVQPEEPVAIGEPLATAALDEADRTPEVEDVEPADAVEAASGEAEPAAATEAWPAWSYEPAAADPTPMPDPEPDAAPVASEADAYSEAEANAEPAGAARDSGSSIMPPELPELVAIADDIHSAIVESGTDAEPVQPSPEATGESDWADDVVSTSDDLDAGEPAEEPEELHDLAALDGAPEVAEPAPTAEEASSWAMPEPATDAPASGPTPATEPVPVEPQPRAASWSSGADADPWAMDAGPAEAAPAPVADDGATEAMEPASAEEPTDREPAAAAEDEPAEEIAAGPPEADVAGVVDTAEADEPEPAAPEDEIQQAAPAAGPAEPDAEHASHEPAQAAVEGGSEPPAPRPFGPSSKPGSPFAGPLSGKRDD